MLLKLDENLGERGRDLFADSGHDVATVADQGLAGAIDSRVLAACQVEGRCLVTMDLDFSNPFRFPPEQFAGIAVLLLSRRPTPDDLLATIRTLIAGPDRGTIVGKLWIIERHRIREHLPEDDPTP